MDESLVYTKIISIATLSLMPKKSLTVIEKCFPFFLFLTELESVQPWAPLVSRCYLFSEMKTDVLSLRSVPRL